MTLLAAHHRRSCRRADRPGRGAGGRGFVLLLPRPRGGRSRVASPRSSRPSRSSGRGSTRRSAARCRTVIGDGPVLLFSAGALGFGTVLVVQRNPARGAIAFAFVILSTCGLFLLLAAPFLMAATIIIYAGAIIVTFLFVLMLSQVAGPVRRERPHAASRCSAALAGLRVHGPGPVHALRHASASSATAAKPIRSRSSQRLPAPVLTDEERAKLADAVAKLDDGRGPAPRRPRRPAATARIRAAPATCRTELDEVVGESARSPRSSGPIRRTTGVRSDPAGEDRRRRTLSAQTL